jgi:hypothetical protein
LDDLPPLPSQFETLYNVHVQDFCTRAGTPPTSPRNSTRKKRVPSKYEGHGSAWPLVRTILACHWQSVLKVTVLKIITCGLSFVGPMLLGALVKLSKPPQHSIKQLYMYIVFLRLQHGVVCHFTSVQWNIRVVTLHLSGAVTIAQSLSSSHCAWC